MGDEIHTHLKNKELYVLKQLAKGCSYESIAKASGMELQTVYTLCLSIRKKTGIHSTTDRHDCAQWLKRHPTGRILPRRESELSLEPTPTQQEIMRLFILGIGIPHIARRLKMGKQTAMNHLSIGCRRAGVRGTGPYIKRIDAILEWFDNRPSSPVVTMDDPMFQ